MNQLEHFTQCLIGNFDNKEQLLKMSDTEKLHFPLAIHKNTIVNNYVDNLPVNFSDILILEESYYTVGEHTNAQPHLFGFALDDNGEVVLSSYSIPKDYPKEKLKFSDSFHIDFNQISLSDKFNPLTYHLVDGVFSGANESMFTPSLKFILDEKISDEELVIKESMWMNGKRTFGFDSPIIYKRSVGVNLGAGE